MSLISGWYCLWINFSLHSMKELLNNQQTCGSDSTLTASAMSRTGGERWKHVMQHYSTGASEDVPKLSWLFLHMTGMVLSHSAPPVALCLWCIIFSYLSDLSFIIHHHYFSAMVSDYVTDYNLLLAILAISRLCWPQRPLATITRSEQHS